MPPGTESSTLPRGLPISLDPAFECLMEGVEVGSQRLVSVDREEAIQSIQGEHVPSEVVVESVEVFKRLQESFAPDVLSLEAEGNRHYL